jgi:hypothetical protein
VDEGVKILAKHIIGMTYIGHMEVLIAPELLKRGFKAEYKAFVTKFGLEKLHFFSLEDIMFYHKELPQLVADGYNLEKDFALKDFIKASEISKEFLETLTDMVVSKQISANLRLCGSNFLSVVRSSSIGRDDIAQTLLDNGAKPDSLKKPYFIDESYVPEHTIETYAEFKARVLEEIKAHHE